MKDKFFEYALHTPNNSNRNVMSSMLADIEEEKIKEELFQFLERQNNSVNPSVLKTWIDNVFKNFGKGVTYTVRIDQTNKNPLTCCVYMDDAIGIEKGSSAWDQKEIFKSIKPCMFKEGRVNYYLNPSNFTQTADGVDIEEKLLSGEDGDVMIEFEKFAYRIYDEGQYVYVSISNSAEDIAKDLRYKYLPFTRKQDGDCEKVYIGAFHGSVMDNKLRSLPAMPTVNITIGDARNAAQTNGEGYEQLTFYQWTMLQCLYLIRYGNLNAQACLGKGYTEAEDVDTAGMTVYDGMYHGSIEDGTVHVKFAGIEDFYGNIGNFIDGIYCNDNYHAMAATTNFNDSAQGYTDLGAIGVEDNYGVLETIWGDTALGFIPKTYVTGEEFYSDSAGVRSGCLAVAGACFGDGSEGGPFFFLLNFRAGFAGWYVGARLSYYK